MMGRWFNVSPRADILVLVVCVALSLTLLLLDEQPRAVIADRMGGVLGSPVAAIESFVRTVHGQRDENDRLRQRIMELEMQAATAERVQRDAERLAGPALEAGYAGDMIPCRVVMRQRSRFATQIKIRSLEPVEWRPWQPVISRTGYLGRVRTVLDEREAWVELLSAPDFALGVEVLRSGVVGVLRPRGDRFEMEMVGRDADVQAGDELVTSGIAEVTGAEGGDVARTPRGFPVGVVTAADRVDQQIFLQITVEPAAGFDVNETVFAVVELDGGGRR